jgi:hypothetical protein
MTETMSANDIQGRILDSSREDARTVLKRYSHDELIDFVLDLAWTQNREAQRRTMDDIGRRKIVKALQELESRLFSHVGKFPDNTPLQLRVDRLERDRDILMQEVGRLGDVNSSIHTGPDGSLSVKGEWKE